MNLVEFQRENWRDASMTLPKFADQLDSGELPVCSVGVMAMRDPSGQVELFAFGPVVDDLQSLAMFRLAEQKLIDVLLEGGEGQVCRGWVRHACDLSDQGQAHITGEGSKRKSDSTA